MCETCITCIEWIVEDWACRWDPAIAADCIKNGRARYMELLGPQATYRLRQLNDRIGALDAEIERLKTALEFYAEKTNWPSVDNPDVALDGGFVAQKALKGGE